MFSLLKALFTIYIFPENVYIAFQQIEKGALSGLSVRSGLTNDRLGLGLGPSDSGGDRPEEQSASERPRQRPRSSTGHTCGRRSGAGGLRSSLPARGLSPVIFVQDAVGRQVLRKSALAALEGDCSCHHPSLPSFLSDRTKAGTNRG